MRSGKTSDPNARLLSLFVADIAHCPSESGSFLSTEAETATRVKVPCLREYLKTPHKHREHEINLITKGRGYLLGKDGSRWECAAGQVILIRGEVEHHLVPDDRAVFWGLYLDTDITEGGDGLPSVKCSSDPQIYRSIQELLEQYMVEYGSDSLYRSAYLEGLSQLLIIQVRRLASAETESSPPGSTISRVLAVRDWIDRHYREEIRLSELAARACLSTSRFHEVFKRVVGETPKSYMIRQKLNHAATLLMESGLSVSEVAWCLGFDHLSHFDRLFRRFYGATPKEYRKNVQLIV